MRDAAMALPLLTELAEKATSGNLGDKQFEDACKSFEDEMIPRTFEWVKKSGGNQAIVSLERTMTSGLADWMNSHLIPARLGHGFSLSLPLNWFCLRHCGHRSRVGSGFHSRSICMIPPNYGTS